MDGDDGLDPSVLRGLRELGDAADPNLLADLVALFIADAQSRVAKLRQAVATADSARVRELGHALHGSAANLGARRMAATAAELEGRGAELDGAAGLVLALEQELDRLRVVLPAALGLPAA